MTPTQPTASMESFFTRSAGNEGTRMPLYHPVTSEITDHWIHVLSVDSDAYHRANSIALRASATINTMKGAKKRAAAIEEQSLNIITALVAGWSFDKPCTPDNVKVFLREAPQIRNAINRVAADRSLFTKSSSQPLEPTVSPASSLTESQPGQP
jgi:hypothetical protein